MAHSVRRHLRVAVAEYDATIRRYIPGYDELLAHAAGAVEAASPDLVLDLGSGTGALSEAILAQPDVGRVELVDVDAEMMEQARSRLSRHGERACFTLRSYDEPFPPCDAMAAALSLHHIAGLAAKTDLFARAFEALPPGGVLVNADVNMPADSAESERLYRYWADHLVACGIDEARAWQHFEEWSEEDTYLPLEAELQALSAIGFDAQRIWQDGPLNVVVARKP